MASFYLKLFTFFLCFLLIIPAISAYNKKKCDAKPSETGPCRALFPMWRYIKKTNKCEAFTYGGCKGTKNMFETEEECKQQCMSGK